MAIYSYDLQGKKDSFADWISNISPEDTFIVTNSKKESTPQPNFKWQTDALSKVIYDLTSQYEVLEGANVDPTTDVIKVRSTVEKNGNTQIFAKAFAISDSALATSVHGRQGELKYQLEKAGKELKQVMEAVFLSKQVRAPASATQPPKTDGLFAQIAPLAQANPDLPATLTDTAVHIEGKIDKATFDRVTNALFMAGSEACTIIVNPINAPAIAAVSMEYAAKIKQQQTFAKFKWDEVKPAIEGYDEMYSITDLRGCQWCVQFSRVCPVDVVYFVGPEYLTQKVLREPKASQMGRTGASETWQLVIEAGLCLANPYSCGVIEVK